MTSKEGSIAVGQDAPHCQSAVCQLEGQDRTSQECSSAVEQDAPPRQSAGPTLHQQLCGQQVILPISFPNPANFLPTFRKRAGSQRFLSEELGYPENQ